MNWLRSLFANPNHPTLPISDSPPEMTAELMEAEQAANELVDYLLSDRLFWQIVTDTPAGVRRPKMTLGGLWERIRRLQAAPELGPNDRNRLAVVQAAWDAARRRYPAQFTLKLKRELDSFLKNWKYYLEQHASDPERWQQEYDVEVRNRERVVLITQLLGPEAPPGLLEDLAMLEANTSNDENTARK